MQYKDYYNYIMERQVIILFESFDKMLEDRIDELENNVKDDKIFSSSKILSADTFYKKGFYDGVKFLVSLLSER